jgi:hypothetical protein
MQIQQGMEQLNRVAPNVFGMYAKLILKLILILILLFLYFKNY